MKDEEIVKTFNEAFAKLIDEENEGPTQFCLFANKPMFFATQEKNYFVIGTRILINPVLFAHKRKYKKHIDEMFDSFEKTNLDTVPAFKTRNAAKRAVAYNRKHEWLTEKQEKEVDWKGYKLINTQPGIFMTEIDYE